MADSRRDPADQPRQSRDNANDDIEREDVTPTQKRGDAEAARGQGAHTGPTDPDSAESDIDRDDMIDD